MDGFFFIIIIIIRNAHNEITTEPKCKLQGRMVFKAGSTLSQIC